MVKSDVFLYKVSWRVVKTRHWIALDVFAVESEMNPAVFISKGGFVRYWFENWAIFIQQWWTNQMYTKQE